LVLLCLPSEGRLLIKWRVFLLSPALSTAPLLHEQPTYAGISHDNCSPENNNERDALH